MGTVAAAPTAAVASSVIQTIPSQAIRTVDAAAAAKRNKKRKMPERSMPDKVCVADRDHSYAPEPNSTPHAVFYQKHQKYAR